jgi:amino-acid N-acetyltransferase
MSVAKRAAAHVDPFELRRAMLADIPALEHFIAAYTGDGTLLPRNRANLLAHLGDFVLCLHGHELVGCGALQRVDNKQAEIRSVAVRPASRGHGLGGRIVESLVERARSQGLASVFCLTRQVPFFAHHGFTVVPKETFPHKIWNDCRLCPRQHDCDEVAMQRALHDTPRAAISAATRAAAPRPQSRPGAEHA